MDEPRSRPLDRLDAVLVLVLMLAVLAMRMWQLSHTEVLARDSIGFIRIAYQLEQFGWREAVAGAQQHPGFPVAVLGVRKALGPWLGDDLPVAWQLAAQIASGVASLLLVIPVYLLGRRLFDRPTAVASVVLLQCFPALGRLFGDGLSEAVFLLFAAGALWATFRAFDTGKTGWFVAVGGFSGLAYFVRPEGLLVAFCAGVVLLGRQAWRGSRQPWGLVLRRGTGLAVAGLLFVAAFFAATGKVTLKPSALRMGSDLVQPESRLAPRTAGPLLASWWEGDGDRSHRAGWAATQLGKMVVRGTFHVGWVFGLLALWWFRDRLGQPGVQTLGLLCLVVGLVLFRLAWFLGYLSDRHLALILLAFTPFVAAGLIEAGRRAPFGKAWLPAVLVLALAAPAAYRTLQPLHDERDGFRAAGEWLAKNTEPGDFIFDPFAWTHYYAGRVFFEKQPAVPTSQPPVEYVLLEHGPSKHPRHQIAIDMAKAKIQQGPGKLLKAWEIDRGTLEVYRVPR